MNPVAIIEGSGPIILGQPHSGTYVPPDIWGALNKTGRSLKDTDWHIPELYDGLLDDVTIVRANFNRYVIDPNRDPSGVSLYSGQNTTGLVPLISFDDEPIWSSEPDAVEIERRREAFHAPYHKALAAQIARVKTAHGIAVLYDCHSIRSEISHLFEGRLPDLNIGTFEGVSCDARIADAALRACGRSGFTHVLNGRFKGGWTTRHYGKPETGVHAIQMELTQINYLKSEAPPFAYGAAKAEKVRGVLADVLGGISRACLEMN